MFSDTNQFSDLLWIPVQCPKFKSDYLQLAGDSTGLRAQSQKTALIPDAN